MAVNLRRTRNPIKQQWPTAADRMPLPPHRHPLLSEFVSLAHPYGSAGEQVAR